MSRVHVSDIALLRFLERTGGIDVEGMRARIAASLERAHDAALTMGSTAHLILADGLVYVVRHGTVTTVLDEGNRTAQAVALMRRAEAAPR